MDFKSLKKILVKELFLSKNVFILGHNNMDMDAFASVLGFSLICKKYKKKFYLVSDDKVFDYGINKTFEKMKNIHFIDSKTARDLIDDKSLIVVLDVNKKKLICLDNLSSYSKVVIIDHHDTNSDTVDTEYLYIDKTVSSVSEIVSMLLRKFRINIPKMYATLLLSGIILDTNGLSYKLNRRTFFYCYYLLVNDADMNLSQELLKDDFNSYLRKVKLIEKTSMYDSFAVVVDKSNDIYSRKDIAMVADTLLTFQDIKSCVVVAKIDDNIIGISARSIDKIDVNRFMNNFGGGGNKNEGAAVIENANINDIENKILELIKR